MDAHRRRSHLRSDQILEYLDDSEHDFSEDSDNDPTYQQGDVRSQSSDNYTDGEEDSSVFEAPPSPVPVPSPSSSFINISSARRARIRGTSRTRRGRGRVLRVDSTARAGNDISLTVNQWQVTNFEPTIHSMTSPNYIERDHSETEWYKFFEEYIDDDILTKMVDASNQTYVQIKGRSLGLNLKELKVFIGISLLMSAINYPMIDLYWNRKWKVKIIADAMTRDRFYAIRTSLKVVFDNDVTNEERLNRIWKVMPLFQRVLQGCHLQKRSEHISIDEMIIPFSGSCALKQYCPNKPNPVGLKVFVAANPDGLILDMVVYQGEKTFEEYSSQGHSLGESAILKLTETLVPGHYLYFDRYFSTIKLFDELLVRGFNSTGTIMKNRIPKTCDFTDDKNFMKKPRGSTEVKCRADGKIAITKWLDNKPVLMISSCFSDTVCDTCRRWNKRLKQYQTVRRPQVIQKYNSFMGGVDLADRMLAVCPERSRTKKWTIRFIFHMIDISVTNAWTLYRNRQLSKGVQTHKVEQLREFKINLGEKLITENLPPAESEDMDGNLEGELRNAHRKRRVEIKPIPPLQNRKALHLPEYTNVQMRCRKEGCHMKSTVKCRGCDIYLCLVKNRNCFLQFHEQ